MPVLTEPSIINRRALLLGSATLVAGCSPRQVILDRTSLAGVRRVGLPTVGFPNSPDVQVINGVGKHFGLIGLISTAVVQGNRSDAVVALMARGGFDLHAYFQERLTARLATLNFRVTPQAADRNRHSFLEAYTSGDVDDAVLDIFVSRYGFFAFSDSDDSPYRPGVALGMRLVGRDRSVLMQDQVANSGIDAPVGTTVPPSLTTFGEAMANPELALSALRLAFDYAADSVQSRLS